MTKTNEQPLSREGKQIKVVLDVIISMLTGLCGIKPDDDIIRNITSVIERRILEADEQSAYTYYAHTRDVVQLKLNEGWMEKMRFQQRVEAAIQQSRSNIDASNRLPSDDQFDRMRHALTAGEQLPLSPITLVERNLYILADLATLTDEDIQAIKDDPRFRSRSESIDLRQWIINELSACGLRLGALPKGYRDDL